MSKIINFPVKKQNSNGYYNLVALFKICDNVESCNFYLDAAEHLFENDHITEKELFTLRRIGRRKRIELATPVQGSQAVNTMMIISSLFQKMEKLKKKLRRSWKK